MLQKDPEGVYTGVELTVQSKIPLSQTTLLWAILLMPTAVVTVEQSFGLAKTESSMVQNSKTTVLLTQAVQCS